MSVLMPMICGLVSRKGKRRAMLENKKERSLIARCFVVVVPVTTVYYYFIVRRNGCRGCIISIIIIMKTASPPLQTLFLLFER